MRIRADSILPPSYIGRRADDPGAEPFHLPAQLRCQGQEFLQRYLKLTHCDLFFADAAILVEGNVERLLMPLMIEKAADRLRSVALCILEVGGPFGHRFKELIEFLGISTLIVTDIDSVTASERPTEGGKEDEDVEIDMPAAGTVPAVTLHGTMCLPGTAGAVTSNQTLIKWLPRMRAIDDLLDAPEPRVAK